MQKPEAHGAVFISCGAAKCTVLHAQRDSGIKWRFPRVVAKIASPLPRELLSSGWPLLCRTPLPSHQLLTARSQSQEWGAAAWPAAQPPVQPQAVPAGSSRPIRSKPTSQETLRLAVKKGSQPNSSSACTGTRGVPPTSSLGSPGWRRSAASSVARMDSLALTLRSCGPEMAALKRS